MTTICLKVFLILWTYVGFSQGSGIKAKLKSLVVTSDIKVRYARTLVSAEYFNDKNSPAIADLQVTLPDRAYISNFSMEMNGKVSVGEVKEKEKAKNIFSEAVNQGESAGYVSVNHRFYNVFDMTVNIEPNNKVVFNLTYEELLKRTNRRYKHRVLLPSEEIIDKLIVEVFISEPQKIKIFEEDPNKAVSVRSLEYIDNKHVYIKFDPTKEEQMRLIKAGDREFVVEYDVERTDSNLLYTLDGYFVHFYAPDEEPTWPKNVVIMIDVSGSMGGDKLKQVKLALRKILGMFNGVKDTFILGTFDGSVQWQHFLSLQEAMDFVNSLEASGGTNMNKAMLESLDRFNKRSHSVNILFFLTDGEPTSGVTNKETIRSNIKKANKENFIIITLGFGDDCDFEFLNNIASENGGISRKIYAAEDSSTQIIKLFESISKLVLKNVIVTYLNTTIDTRYLTSTAFNTIFSGSEIAIAGRIKNTLRSGGIMLQLSGESPSGKWIKKMKLEFDELDFLNSPEIPKFPNLTRFEMLPDISKKTWAYVTIKQMIEKNAPRDDIVTLAIENSFVTPYTSMVVTKKHLKGDVHEERKNTRGSPGVAPSSKPVVVPHLTPVFDPNLIPDLVPHLTPVFDPHLIPDLVPHLTPVFDPFSEPDFRGSPGVAGSAGVGGSPGVAGSPGGPGSPGGVGVFDLPTDAQFNLASVAVANPVGAGSQGGATFSLLDLLSNHSGVAYFRPSENDSYLRPDLDLVPDLNEIPAVVVTPYGCDQVLCVTQDMVCTNVTKLLLLRDRRADVEIYSYPLENDNCTGDFKKITIQTRRKHYEVTPSVAIINGKRINMTNRPLTRLKFKNFLQLNVFFNRERIQPTVSVQFIVLNEMHNAAGLYSQYMKRFDCNLQPNGELTLSHMTRKFTNVSITSPIEDGIDSCYM